DRARPPRARSGAEGVVLPDPVPARYEKRLSDAGTAAELRPVVRGGGAGLRHSVRSTVEGSMTSILFALSLGPLTDASGPVKLLAIVGAAAVGALGLGLLTEGLA